MQTYISHLPGELSKKWHIGSMQRFAIPVSRTESSRLLSQLRLNFAFAIAMTMLKFCATSPPLLQRMFIRSVQPFFVSGIIMSFFIVIESPVYTSVLAVSVAAFAAYFVYRYLQGLQNDLKEKNMVHPLDPSIYEEKEEIVDIQDELYDSDASSVNGPVERKDTPKREDDEEEEAEDIIRSAVEPSSLKDSDSVYDSPSSQGSLSDEESSVSITPQVIVTVKEDDFSALSIQSEALSSHSDVSSISMP